MTAGPLAAATVSLSGILRRATSHIHSHLAIAKLNADCLCCTYRGIDDSATGHASTNPDTGA